MPEPRRILVVRLGDLGDVLLAEPALRSLQSTESSTRVDLLTSPPGRPVAELIGVSGDVLTLDRRPAASPRSAIDFSRRALRVASALSRRTYDSTVLLHHLTTSSGALRLKAVVRASGARKIYGLDNGRGTFLTHAIRDRGFGEQHEVDYMLAVARLAGGANVDPAPSLKLRKALPAPDIPAGGIVIAPVSGSYAPARDWPLEKYADLISSLATDQPDNRFIIVGDDAATDVGATLAAVGDHVIDLTGQTSIPELACTINDARLVIANDSFPGHLAAALGTPIVSIFGPSNTDAWRPYGSLRLDESAVAARTGILVQGDYPCSPCLYTGHQLGRRFGCPARTCLRDLEVETVLDAVRRILGGSP